MLVMAISQVSAIFCRWRKAALHWTAEERAKQSALIRQWQPWTRSTGARTPEGKAISSQNGYKGGHRTMLREISFAIRQQKKLIDVIGR
jgi:hypothetical protein